jgi:hypothetical protein
MFRFCWWVAAAALAAVTPAAAQTAAYDNTTNSLSGGVKTNATTIQGSNTITSLLVDDITFAPGSAGQTVTAITVTVDNPNGSTVTARPFLRFWNADGAGGGPGTYFSPGGTPLDVNFGPTQLSQMVAPNYLGIVLEAKSFQIPASEKLWVGIGFDDANGTTGATPAQLRNLGFSLFDPPTIGSSADIMYLTNTSGSFLGVDNPAVTPLNFNGDPVLNAGFRFGVNPVPEPTGMLAVGLVAVVGYAARRCKPTGRTPV